MPNRRGLGLAPDDLETARPWTQERWSVAESAARRGDPGSRGVGPLPRSRETHEPSEWCGVNPLPPLLPAMPRLKPGDQGG